MEVASTTLEHVAAPLLGVGWLRAARIAGRWLTVGLMAVSVLLCARRLSGAAVAPLDAATLALCGLSAAIVAGGCRWLGRFSSDGASESSRLTWLEILPSAALLLFGLAICVPGSSGWGIAAFWIAALVEEWAVWGRWPDAAQRPPRVRIMTPPLDDTLDDTTERQRPADAADEELAEEDAEALVHEADRIEQYQQRLTRSTTAEGEDVLRADCYADLAAGQIHSAVHVAFCPPFARAPQIEVEQVDGPEARVKVGQNLPWGDAARDQTVSSQHVSLPR